MPSLPKVPYLAPCPFQFLAGTLLQHIDKAKKKSKDWRSWETLQCAPDDCCASGSEVKKINNFPTKAMLEIIALNAIRNSIIIG